MSGVAIHAMHDAIESDSQAILIIDAQGTVLHVDEVAEKYLGDRADAFCGLNIRRLFSGVVKENESVAGVARETGCRRCAVGIGNRGDMVVDARIRRLGGGQDARFLATFEPAFDLDVARNHGFVRAVLDTVDSITAVVDDQGVIVYVNERWCEFAEENGGDPARIGVGQNYLRACETSIGKGAEQGRAVCEALREILNGSREKFHIAYPCHGPTQWRWFQVRGNRFYYRGRIFGVLTHERIDELKQAEEQLQQKRTRLEDAAALANLGYFERNMRNGPAVEWSPEMVRIMGRELSAVKPEIGTFYDIVHPDDRENVRAVAVQAMKDKRWYDTEFRIVHANGDLRWIHSVARPVLDENGEIDRFFGVLQDVTSYKHAIAELELKNEVIEAARLEADQANTAKSRFLAMMSHEIRTPLNGVLGMTGVLLDNITDSAQRDIVETIRTSGDALLTIINDILDFSKIEAGLMELEEQPFVLRHCLDDVIDLIGPRARTKFIELGFVVNPDVPVGIFGDITRLRQVLVNLLSNALKFTDAGEVAVEVKLGEPDPRGKLQLHFLVRDTGIGIAAERITRLFQTFSQVDASINRKYGGTGLGLAICKRLVELMGGKIWVDSTPGVGTTFQFTIPTTSAPDVKSEMLDAIALARRDLEGKRVLIVDDSPMTRAILTDQVQSFGLVPVVASSGEEALALLRAKPDNVEAFVDVRSAFLLVILDLEMPEMNGFHIADVIREDAYLHHLPILFVTASDTVTTSMTVEWGAPCLSKPVKQSTLFDGIMRVLLNSPLRSSRGPRSIPIDSTLGLRCPLRILLAEDNAINQKVALLLLQRAGYRADVAANGQEVLEAVSTKAYDLILMDVQMPDMDGLEATRRLRGPGPWLGKPRIVAVTADVMQEGKEACIAAGMDDFVAKPIRVQELMRLLERSAVRQTKELANEEVWVPGTEAQLLTADDLTIDEGAFAALRNVCALDGDDTLTLLVTEFLTDSREMLDDLTNLVAKGEYSTTERLAHTLKGTSGTFGAKGLARRMSDIERAIRDRKTAVLEDLLRGAIIEHGRVRDALLARCSIVSLDT